PTRLRTVEPGLARFSQAVASAGVCHAHPGHRHHSYSGVGPHDRVLRFFHGGRPDVAFHNLWSILRGWRYLQRDRSARDRDGAATEVPASRGVSPSGSLSKSGKTPAHHEPALGILRFQRAPDNLVWQCAVGDERLLDDTNGSVCSAVL